MTHTPSRRTLLRLAAAGASLAALPCLRAQDKAPLKLVVITPPGAIVDASSRVLAEGLKVRLNRTVIVENRTGAGGNIATDFVAKAPPDGNTLLVTSNNHTTNPFLYRSLPYDARKDLIPVAHTVDFALVVAANPKLPASTLQEMIALAKARPDMLTFASGGNGSPGHMAVEMLKQLAGIRLQHIPYKGASPAMTDTMAGQVDMAGGSLSSALPFIKTGQLKGLAVTGRQRAASAPQIPTMVESGLSAYSYTGWIGLMAPKGTPAEVVQMLHAAINAVVGGQEFRASVEAQGGEAVQQSVADFGAMLHADFALNEKLIKAANIQL